MIDATDAGDEGQGNGEESSHHGEGATGPIESLDLTHVKNEHH